MRKLFIAVAIAAAPIMTGTRAFAAVCVAMPFGDFNVALPYTLVLKNVSLHPGKSGPIAGYAVRSDGLFEPVTGGYVVGPASASVSLTRSAVVFRADGSGGLVPETTFHNLAIPVDGGSASHCSWRRNSDGSVSDACGTIARVSCKTVAPVPKKLVLE